MIFISHRGNIDKANPELENTPQYITKAIQKGYNVEIDVWFENNKYYLGHDKAKIEIDEFLLYHPSLWIHAKTTETLIKLKNKILKGNIFYSKDDEVCCTTTGSIILCPMNKIIIPDCIIMMPEDLRWNKIKYMEELRFCKGICSDKISIYKFWLGGI